MDRGVPNHQIGSHADFDGNQQPMSIAAIGAKTKDIAIVSGRPRSSANDNHDCNSESGNTGNSRGATKDRNSAAKTASGAE
jgi:hypothetical protein